MSAYETESYSSQAEAESEQESFFNHLAAAADRTGRPQSLRRVALAAAREAFRGANASYPVIEGELEHEFESEFESEFEHEATLNPVSAGSALALMEHMAHEAAAAESESEAAEQFLPLIPLAAKALLPLAMKALPVIGKIGAKVGGKLLTKVAPKLLKRVVPNLTRGISQLTRGLFRNRSTRPLLRAVPNIARRTVTNLARQIASGRKVTPQTAARMLASQTKRVIANPRQLQNAYRRSQRADAVYHNRASRFTGGQASALSNGQPASCPNCGVGANRRRPAFTSAPMGPTSSGCQCATAKRCACCGR
jgi:hypothetical protein